MNFFSYQREQGRGWQRISPETVALVRRLRSQGFTQPEVAAMAKVGRTTVSSIDTGKYPFDGTAADTRASQHAPKLVDEKTKRRAASREQRKKYGGQKGRYRSRFGLRHIESKGNEFGGVEPVSRTDFQFVESDAFIADVEDVSMDELNDCLPR